MRRDRANTTKSGSVRRRLTIVAVAIGLCSACLTGAGAAGTSAPAPARAAVGGTWGTAVQIPGSDQLNKGGKAGLASVSCAAPGDCSAGGFYASGRLGNNSPIPQALVARQKRGTWQLAQEVPGTKTLNAGGKADTLSVSCAAPGDCSAGGYYAEKSGREQAFVVNETNGTWGTAEQVPGTAALNRGAVPGATIFSLSCRAVGDCSAGGTYTDASGHQQAFVVDEAGGSWGTAKKVPGAAALNAGGYAKIQSVSCTAPGDCSAGGVYASSANDGIPVVQAFVVNETGGRWGRAEEVPGTAALNGGGYAEITSVSCASAGNCSAGGQYTTSSSATQAFVVNETGGSWGTAEQVAGTAALNQGLLAETTSVSCAAAGNCSAGGFYQDASFNFQVFVVNETNGTWGTAEQVPGTAALNQGSPGASNISMSCGAAGDCSAGGNYTDASGHQQAFVVNETGGTWGTAEQVPGTAALNVGGFAALQSVSCTTATTCTGTGVYEDANLNQHLFAVNEVK